MTPKTAILDVPDGEAVTWPRDEEPRLLSDEEFDALLDEAFGDFDDEEENTDD